MEIALGLFFILHFFFGTKIDVNFHYNVKTVLYTGATEYKESVIYNFLFEVFINNLLIYIS